jgi:hypothetical protein
MKKNKMMRFASVLLVAVLLSTCAISGTFAKYTSSGSATATATIAKWDIQLKGAAITNDVEFSLVDTWVNTDESVTDSVADKKIAPGTSGSGEIVLENKSEVAAEIVASFVATGKPANMTITYTYKNSNGADGTVADDTPIAIGIGETVTITVDWEWTFTNTDETDYAGKDIKVDASFTVSQVD